MFTESKQAPRRSRRDRDLGVQTPGWVLRTGLVTTLLIAASGCGPNPRPPVPPQSLFERLGGTPPLQRWVDDLTWRLAADPEVGETIVRADLAALKRQMLLMTCAITGGRCEYDLDRLVKAHAGIALTESDLERFLRIAAESAAAVGLPEPASKELVERLRTLRPRLGLTGDRVGSGR